MSTYKYKFGQRIKCHMTGVEGNIDAIVEWNNGSRQYSLNVGPKENGEEGDSSWMDWQNFTEVEGGCRQSAITPVFDFEIDDKVSIKNNPFIGNVIGMAFYSNGCARYMLRSKNLHEGCTISQWFSSADMNKINVPKTITKSRAKSSSIGGPSSSSKSSRT